MTKDPELQPVAIWFRTQEEIANQITLLHFVASHPDVMPALRKFAKEELDILKGDESIKVSR